MRQGNSSLICPMAAKPLATAATTTGRAAAGWRTRLDRNEASRVLLWQAAVFWCASNDLNRLNRWFWTTLRSNAARLPAWTWTRRRARRLAAITATGHGTLSRWALEAHADWLGTTAGIRLASTWVRTAQWWRWACKIRATFWFTRLNDDATRRHWIAARNRATITSLSWRWRTARVSNRSHNHSRRWTTRVTAQLPTSASVSSAWNGVRSCATRLQTRSTLNGTRRNAAPWWTNWWTDDQAHFFAARRSLARFRNETFSAGSNARVRTTRSGAANLGKTWHRRTTWPRRFTSRPAAWPTRVRATQGQSRR